MIQYWSKKKVCYRCFWTLCRYLRQNLKIKTLMGIYFGRLPLPAQSPPRGIGHPVAERPIYRMVSSWYMLHYMHFYSPILNDFCQCFLSSAIFLLLGTLEKNRWQVLLGRRTLTAHPKGSISQRKSEEMNIQIATKTHTWNKPTLQPI